MSHAIHFLPNNVSGCGRSEGRCLSFYGISGRTVVLPPCLSRVDCKIHLQVKIGSLKCDSRRVSFVCKATSGGNRRNPDFSRQSKHGFRGRNRQNEERDSFDSLDDSEILPSKNGPLFSLSNSPKFQATAAPGPREKEIVELFRKVQAQLRERAAAKEDRKIETSQGQGKASETVDSLLKLLRKHSVEQGKRQSSTNSSQDFNSDHGELNGKYSEDKNTSFFDSRSKMRDEVQEHNNSSPLTRPASNFQRRSPVPQSRYQSVYSSESALNTVSYSNTSVRRKKNQVETHREPTYKPVADPQPEVALGLESEPEAEPEPEPEPESIYQDEDIAVAVPDIVSSDFGDGDNDEDEDGKEEHRIEDGDLNALKLPELRALAKSRGAKGFSKMKKSELVDLLSATSV